LRLVCGYCVYINEELDVNEELEKIKKKIIKEIKETPDEKILAGIQVHDCGYLLWSTQIKQMLIIVRFVE